MMNRVIFIDTNTTHNNPGPYVILGISQVM